MGTDIQKRHDLTEKQTAFVQHVSDGVDPAAAAVLAGYGEAGAASEGSRQLRLTHVLAAIHSEARRKLVGGSPVALALLMRLMKDDKESSKIRLDAARTWLDRAGHIAPRAIADKSAHEAALHEMGLDDLRALAERLEAEIAGRAKDVSTAATHAQATDLVG